MLQDNVVCSYIILSERAWQWSNIDMCDGRLQPNTLLLMRRRYSQHCRLTSDLQCSPRVLYYLSSYVLAICMALARSTLLGLHPATVDQCYPEGDILSPAYALKKSEWLPYLE